jgi:hypothetical protein
MWRSKALPLDGLLLELGGDRFVHLRILDARHGALRYFPMRGPSEHRPFFSQLKLDSL